VRRLLDAEADRDEMGASGRRFVEQWASPAAVAEAYEQLFEAVRVQTGRSRG
jgi:glycosyltransferase involved in cell wall biosynthesis